MTPPASPPAPLTDEQMRVYADRRALEVIDGQRIRIVTLERELTAAKHEAAINMENFKVTNRAYVKHDEELTALHAQAAGELPTIDAFDFERSDVPKEVLEYIDKLRAVCRALSVQMSELRFDRDTYKRHMETANMRLAAANERNAALVADAADLRKQLRRSKMGEIPIDTLLRWQTAFPVLKTMLRVAKIGGSDIAGDMMSEIENAIAQRLGGRSCLQDAAIDAAIEGDGGK